MVQNDARLNAHQGGTRRGQTLRPGNDEAKAEGIRRGKNQGLPLEKEFGRCEHRSKKSFPKIGVDKFQKEMEKVIKR